MVDCPTASSLYISHDIIVLFDSLPSIVRQVGNVAQVIPAPAQSGGHLLVVRAHVARRRETQRAGQHLDGPAQQVDGG